MGASNCRPLPRDWNVRARLPLRASSSPHPLPILFYWPSWMKSIPQQLAAPLSSTNLAFPLPFPTSLARPSSPPCLPACLPLCTTSSLPALPPTHAFYKSILLSLPCRRRRCSSLSLPACRCCSALLFTAYQVHSPPSSSPFLVCSLSMFLHLRLLIS